MNTTFAQTHICLVGNGRLANQLKAILNRNSISFSHVFRAQHSNAEIGMALKNASHVWLAISDQSIEPFYTTYGRHCQKTWVHFSGAHNSKNIYSAHPLMTFTKTVMPDDLFNQVHFVISMPDGKSKTEAPLALSDLLPGLKNQWSYLDSDKKTLYHALCVVAGNFPVILWSEVQTQFQNLHLPQDTLLNYIERALTNFKNEGAAALTGPIVRGDTKTITENIQALSGSSLQPIYEAFVKSKGIKL